MYSNFFQELLKLWIRHQFIVDQDKEKFLESVWAVAKLSILTEQILLMVTALHREVGVFIYYTKTGLALELKKLLCDAYLAIVFRQIFI